LKKLNGVPVEVVADKSQIKFPSDHTLAKKQIYLTRHQGPGLRPCQGMGDYLCCNYFTLSLVTGCPLECSYCILQDFLANNPVITIHTNIEEILADVEKCLPLHIGERADTALRCGERGGTICRLGPGELSDSLVFDNITEFSADLVNFANDHPSIIMEIKTKTTQIDRLLTLSHNGNTVVAFSVNPQPLIDHEEYNCPNLNDRLHAARKCADHGYPIGFHLDPILYDQDWERLYENLIETIVEKFQPNELAWFSLGTLRFTKDLKRITQERFPHSHIMTSELYPSSDGKIRTFRPLREQQYRKVRTKIQSDLPGVPVYLCMETPTVWKNVFNKVPRDNKEINEMLIKRWKTEENH
jgi:spore photoproduct lyase